MCIRDSINSDPKTIFSEMHQINEKLIMDYSYKGELSMGMSNDYEVALDYGATTVSYTHLTLPTNREV